MKQRILAIGLLFCVFASALVGLTQVSAAGYFKAPENGDVTIAKDQVVSSSAYLAGNHVVVDGTIEGDLYCAGESIIVNGTVTGDVLCAGSTVTIAGDVQGDVRAAGATVTLKGVVGHNVSVAANEFIAEATASVGGDVTAASADAIIEGIVGRDLAVATASLQLGAQVNRDVNASLETLTMQSGAKVQGNLSYESSAVATVPDGTVAGKVTQTPVSQSQRGPEPWAIYMAFLSAFILLALFVTLVMPKYVHEASTLPGRSVLIAFLAGFATLVLLPVVAIMSMATVVGAFIGIVLLSVWGLTIALSGVFSAYYLGTVVMRKRATNALLVVFAGAGIIAILTAIPLVNVIVVIASLCIGIGMQVMHVRHQFSKQPYKIES